MEVTAPKKFIVKVSGTINGKKNWGIKLMITTPIAINKFEDINPNP